MRLAASEHDHAPGNNLQLRRGVAVRCGPVSTVTRRGAVVVVAVLAVALIAWRLARSTKQPARPPRSIRLDVDAFRAEQAARLRRAKELAARPVAAVRSAAAAGTWPMQGSGPAPNMGKDLTTPCILGPGKLCATLADLIDGCDAGDASDCLAVGQFLADTPPRPLIASVFFTQACRIGDAAGCERLDELKPPSTVPCDQDPFACAWRGYRSHDPTLLDQACSLGAADACLSMELLTANDVARSRSYLERACQLGNPMSCEELGRRSSPGCTPSAESPCYPPDPAQAAAAFAIACSAGLETACK